MRRSLSWPATLALAAALAYSSWVLAPVLGSGLDPLRSYTSELAATDQPHSGVYRGADLLAALLLIALGVVVARAGRRLPRRSKRPVPRWRDQTTGGWLLAAMGIATAADAMLALHCAPSADRGCAAAEAAGTLPLTHVLHTGSSVLAAGAMLLAVVVLTGALVADRRGLPERVLLALALAVLIGTALTVAELGVVGLLQRAQLASFALWLGVAGWLAGRGR